MNKILVTKNNDGRLVTTSKIIAEIFGKTHKHVLRDIREMEYSEKFHASNFGLSFEMSELPCNGDLL